MSVAAGAAGKGLYHARSPLYKLFFKLQPIANLAEKRQD
jgi:hypothetical protein